MVSVVSQLLLSQRVRLCANRLWFDLAWTEVLAAGAAGDARHWFAHCGYRTAPN
jgi:hypothetical protein